MRLNCIIVDDEPIARDILQSYIEKIPELNLVKSCKNAVEAYEALYEFSVDLIFMDIQMPVITGIEFLRSLRKSPLVIFTTAYSKFAVEGFELDSVDYLLKPIIFERFYQAVQKALERIAIRPQSTEKMPITNDYIFIKQDAKLVKINYCDIEYIQAEKDFCSIYGGKKRLLASLNLKLFEQMLPPHKFLRIHRSYIINLDKIKALTGNRIELTTMEIPVGANYRELLKKN
ncbi:Two-component system response regulator [Arcticibacter svalbardensis MN12-7]|uniref:Two-component system response regulator n=1 Tax=Arcticibacter svalbardensis MN12-7 TaxID=1150600 RepID=R9GW70_9SPHI|nr:LytTR family DNA-binding domain-containing protein [Arcticibacter svalbardensis]EOR95770.1 Two-component system response regulator [Arcticibacter svalbardensis MN12-7]